MTPPDQPSVLAWIDGEVIPAVEARVSVLDHGFLYGDSVYEAVRTWRGRPFLLGEHLRRLRHSASGIAIPVPPHVPRAVDEVLAAAADDGEHLLRIILTRGVGPPTYEFRAAQEPTLIVLSLPLLHWPERLYREGARLAVVAVRRNPQDSLDPSLKTSNLLNLRLAHMEARRADADDAVLLNHQDEVAEASGSNVFLVERGTLCTPPLRAGILAGVTRAFVLDLAAAEGIAVEESPIPLDRLRGADEIFLTSTTRSVMPATRLDGEAVGQGVPGPVTRRLMAAFERRVGCALC